HRIGAEVFRPQLIAGKIEAIDAVHAEIGVDPFAVRDWGFRRVGIARLRRNQRLALTGSLGPEDLAGRPVETADFELVNSIGRPLSAAEAAATASAEPLPHVLDLLLLVVG